MTELETCSICYESNVDFLTTCNHKFCNSCITSWLLTNNNCPLCRKDIYDVENSDYEDSDDEDEPYIILNFIRVRTRNNITFWLLEDFLNYLNRRRLIPKEYFVYYPKLYKYVNKKYHKKVYKYNNTNFGHSRYRY